MDDWTRSERWGLAALALFTILALAGFATFGRNPELLARFPRLAAFYAPAFGFFAQGHIAVAAGALVLCLAPRTGAAWVPSFVAVAAVSLTAELVGTSTGWPFGEYRYTDLLGPKVAGLVPALIPVSWFMMAVPALALAQGVHSTPGRWALGALLLTSWDLTLDPAMSGLSPYWIWETPGPLYGMPLRNLVGWLLTGAVIMAALEACGARRWLRRIPVGYFAAYYLLVSSLSLVMVAIAGMWTMVVAALPALVWAAVVGRSRPEAAASDETPALAEGSAPR